MFVIEVPYIDLDQIYESGQVFRWIKLREQKYVVPLRDKALKIEQQKERLIMSCTDEQFYDLWYKYFDLQTDYSDINFKAKRIGTEMKICANRGNGVRILKQDLFEVIVTFCLATATNIPRIKQMVQSLSELCGVKHVQSMGEARRITWFEFPTPEMILEHQDKLDRCKLGYRKEMIIGICEDIVEGWLDFEFLQEMTYENAKEYLMQFEGIGPKVADCICLYGLHHLQAFPIDTHIEQILESKYECDDYEMFKEWYLDELQGFEGIVQQYMFYNEINPPKEVTSSGVGRFN